MQTAELSMRLPEDSAAEEQRQLAEIEKGLGEADRGEFASEEEMRVLYRKWGIR